MGYTRDLILRRRCTHPAASKVNRDKLQVLQNKALRLVQQVDKYYDTDLLHSETKMLRLKSRRKDHLLMFMFSLKQANLMKCPRPRKGARSRARIKHDVFMRKPNTEKFKRCASYIGPKRWNACHLRLRTLLVRPCLSTKS